MTSPGFTAEAALAPATRSYRGRGGGGDAPRDAVVPQQGASGVAAGTWCLGGVLSVIVVDLDDQGHVAGWHIIDEIASC